MKNYKIVLFLLLFFLTPVNLVFADNLGDAFQTSLKGVSKLDRMAGTLGAGYDITKRDPELIISTVIQTVLSLLGVIFIILIIYGGGLWMTAKGNEQQVDKARNLITAAIIGLVIVVAAYAISYFVIKTIGGAGFKKLE